MYSRAIRVEFVLLYSLYLLEIWAHYGVSRGSPSRFIRSNCHITDIGLFYFVSWEWGVKVGWSFFWSYFIRSSE